MTQKIYIVPLSEDGNQIAVLAHNESEAGTSVEAAFSGIDGLIMTHHVHDYFTVDSVKEANSYGIQDDYPLDHCGMTVGEFLAEQED